MSVIIDDLPDAPDPVVDPPKTFSTKAAAMVLALKKMVVQFRAAIADFNSWLAGGAYAIPFTFDTALTQLADPGSGKLRLDNANVNSATSITLSTTSSSGKAVDAYVKSMTQSSSATKGTIRITSLDGARYVVYNVTSISSGTGYNTLSLSFVSTPGAAAPFSSAELVQLFFSRTGDKGDQGLQGLTDPPQIFVREEYANGTSVTGTIFNNTARALNTVKTNSISGASLASSQVTLPAGTYNFFGSAPANNVDVHRVALYNVTDAVVQEYGSTERVGANSAVVSTRSFVRGRFTIAASKTFSLRHWMASAATNAGGSASSLAGGNEVFSELFFEKVG